MKFSFGRLWLTLSLCILPVLSQSINSGTVLGTVTDPSGAVVAGAMVRLQNSVTGYSQSVATDNTGTFRFNNVPQNNYRLTVQTSGFAAATQSLDVRSSVPITANVKVTSKRFLIPLVAAAISSGGRA